MLLLLLCHFSRVWLYVTPQTAAHQAPPSLGFSRQEHWSGLPFPSPMHESEKWKWSRSVVSDSSRSHGPQPTGSSVHGIFQARTGVGCHCLLCYAPSNQNSRTDSSWLQLAWLTATGHPFVAAAECWVECNCILQPLETHSEILSWPTSYPHSTILTSSKSQPWREGSGVKPWNPMANILATGSRMHTNLACCHVSPMGRWTKPL